MQKKIYNLDKEEELASFIKLLKLCKVLVMPCDTIYGIVSMVNEENRKRICSIKKRPLEKDFITLASLERAKEIFQDNIPKKIYELWPGKISVIAKEKKSDKTRCLRVPDNKLLERILEETFELYSTSVNLEGERELNTLGQIREQFLEKVDAIGYSNNIQVSQASTIVDLSVKPYRILREGEEALRIKKILSSIE